MSTLFDKEIVSADRIFSVLSKYNPNFYPNAITSKRSDDGTWITEANQKDYMKKQNFVQIYATELSEVLHESRNSTDRRKLMPDGERIMQILFQIITLLNEHWIEITETLSLRVIMKEEKTGDVSFNVMEKQA